MPRNFHTGIVVGALVGALAYHLYLMKAAA